MAFNFGNLKPAGVSKTGTKVAKLVKDTKMKPVNLNKISIMKDKVSKSFDFNKMTKVSKLPKAPKIALMKKAIKKAAKPKGF